MGKLTQDLTLQRWQCSTGPDPPVSQWPGQLGPPVQLFSLIRLPGGSQSPILEGFSSFIPFAGKQGPSVRPGWGPTVDRWAGKSHVSCHIQHPDRSPSKQQRHLPEMSVKGLKVSYLEGLLTRRKEKSKTTQLYRNMPLCYSELPSGMGRANSIISSLGLFTAKCIKLSSYHNSKNSLQMTEACV